MNAADTYQLLGAYAVDALDDTERAEVERYLEAHPDDRAEMHSLRDAAADLSLLTETAPPARLRASVLDEVRRTRPFPPEGSASADVEPTEDVRPEQPRDELAARRRRRAPWLLGAAAAAAVAIGGVGVWSPWDDAPGPTQTAISQITEAPDAQEYTLRMDGGSVTIYRSESQSRAALRSTTLPNAPEGRAYQMWLQHADGSMVSAGLVPRASDGTVTMMLSGDVAQAVGAGMTVEPAGGSRQPTSEPLGIVEFR